MPQHDVERTLVGLQHLVEAALGDLVEAAVLSSFPLRRKREAIIGVSVRATNADTAMHMVVVTANSRNSRPMMPPSSSRGMNTATSEMLIERMVKAISPEPFSAAS